jgi:hypothetical protein
MHANRWEPFTTEDLEDLPESTIPPLTPGLILSVVPEERFHEVALQLAAPLPATEKPHDLRAAAAQLLEQLTIEELRDVAREMHIATDGRWIDVYRRLRLSLVFPVEN